MAAMGSTCSPQAAERVSYMQAVLDRHLNSLLAGTPRRSVLMVDTDKIGSDGGWAPCFACVVRAERVG